MHFVEFPKLGLQFTINDTAFSIGSFQVKWYGIIIAVGFLLAMAYAAKSSKKMGIDMDRLFDAVIAGLIGGVIFARLYYVIFYPGDKYWNNPMEIFNIHSGGLAIYGGIIGALLFGGITAKLRKLNVFAVFDLVSLGFLIGQGIGRWGNFVNQEAFGTPTNLSWGMMSENTGGVPVHPCFLYESLLCLLGFVLLHIFTRKWRRYDGQTFLLYLVWYGFIRFFIEGLRTDSLIIPYVGLRVSQVLAGCCVLAGVILLIVFRRRTSLTGCGNKKVMEAVGLLDNENMEASEVTENEVDTTEADNTNEEENKEVEIKNDPASLKESFSTIFGDLSDEDAKENETAKDQEAAAPEEKDSSENK